METSAKYEERAARINQDIFGVINAKAIYSNSLAEINKKKCYEKIDVKAADKSHFTLERY